MTPIGQERSGRRVAGRLRVSMVALVLALLAGCGLSGGESEDADDMTITVGTPALDGNWIDPMQARNALSTAWIRDAVGEGLARQEIDGSWVPGLATAWKVSEDGLTWTFQLREGVKMHDGSTFTAEDVKTAIDRVVREAAKSPENWIDYLSHSGFAKSVDNVVVVDDQTVEVRTKQPYPNLLQDSPVPIATDYYGKVGEEEFMRAPVAAGPFKFVSQEVNQSIVVARFDDFWDEGRKPNFETLVMKAVPDETTRISGLQSGQLDVVQGLSANGAEQLDGGGDIRVVTSESASLGFIQMLDNRYDAPSPLKNLRVREALLMAVDRQAIADTLYKGYAQVAATPVLTTTDGYDDSIEPQAYDPDRAKQILAEEGAANLELDLNSYTSSPSIPNVMKFVEAIAGYWEKVGVKVNLNLDDNATYVQKSYDKAYKGASVFSINGSFASELTGYVPYFTTDGILTSHADPRFDNLLDKALATMEKTEREEYGRQLNALMRETLYVLPMVRFDNIMAIGPRVAEFKPKVATPIAEPFWYLKAK